jgi:hypothetical protein
MKTLILPVLVFAQFSFASASVLALPNGVLGNVGNVLSTPVAQLPLDIELDVTLIPDTEYTISVDLSTNVVSALLNLVNEDGGVLQIVDQAGVVLDEIPAQELVDLLTGLTGTVTSQLNMVLETAGTTIINPVLRVLDDTIDVTNVVVTPTTTTQSASSARAVNNRPTVRVKKSRLVGRHALLKGNAIDDTGVSRVDIASSGKSRIARGTAKWTARVKLHRGRNHIVVRAFDTANQSSAPKRVVVRVND